MQWLLHQFTDKALHMNSLLRGPLTHCSLILSRVDRYGFGSASTDTDLGKHPQLRMGSAPASAYRVCFHTRIWFVSTDTDVGMRPQGQNATKGNPKVEMKGKGRAKGKEGKDPGNGQLKGKGKGKFGTSKGAQKGNSGK